MHSSMMDDVTTLMRDAADIAILPRFQKLQARQIEEKTPGEVVTIADREAEEIMASRLLELLPGSRVVGEEAVAAEPSLLDQLGEGLVWLVDPLDGTASFIAGAPAFAVMIALLDEGQTMASWLLNPVSGTVCTASLGGGAFIDGVQVRTSMIPLLAAECRGSVLTRFLPNEIKARVTERTARLAEVLPGAKCAGVDYPAVLTGSQNFLVFWRTLPWDHTPGALLLTEAGGCVARFDGSEYRPAESGSGLLVAENRDIWENIRSALLSYSI